MNEHWDRIASSKKEYEEYFKALRNGENRPNKGKTGDNAMRRIFGVLAATLTMALIVMVAKPAGAGDTYDQYDQGDDAGIYALVQDVDHHFYEARVDFETGKNEDAAKEIRTAVVFLKIERYRASGDEEKALTASISELQGVADDVENGNVASGTRLHDAFSHAQIALAMNSWVKALEAWNQQDFTTASRHLKASQAHLERAITWADHRQKKEVR